MKCVFCNREYPLDAIVCVDCNDYKGMEFSASTATTLSVALNDAFTLMEEAREHHLETHPSDCDCDYRAGEE
jgi:hypothetical protein